MEKNYLYISDSPDGWKNLAVDEWILDHTEAGNLTLYFYVNANAVIIGKNQNPWKECNLNAMRRDSVQLVRRISGGGAVYHDRGNLNFSFNVGKNRVDFDKTKQQEFILEILRDLGIPCEFSGRNDLLAGGRKFSGNAYCSRGTGRQHHGTLLISSDLSKLQNYLTVDPRKIQSKGVDSVRARVCNLCEFLPGLTVEQMEHLIPETFQKLYGDFEILSFSEKDLKEIGEYYLRHSSRDWILGNTPEFDYAIDCRLSFGGIQTLLKLKEGRILSCKTYTDANDVTIAQRIDGLLTGLPFNSFSMAAALSVAGDPSLAELAEYVSSLQL